MPFKLRKVRLSFAFRMFVLNSVFVMSLKKVSWCKTLSVWNMMFYWEFFTSSHIVLPLTCSHFSWSQYFHWFLKGKMISCTVIFSEPYCSILAHSTAPDNFRDPDKVLDWFYRRWFDSQYCALPTRTSMCWYIAKHGQRPTTKEERATLKWL